MSIGPSLLSVLFVGIILCRLLCNHKTVWILSKHYNEMVCNYSFGYELSTTVPPIFRSLIVYESDVIISSNWKYGLSFSISRPLSRSLCMCVCVRIEFRFCQMYNLTSIINHLFWCHFDCIRSSLSTNYSSMCRTRRIKLSFDFF